jgi:pyruvate/2-oxoglutarate dehydrogenase complex dihydrolipoamide acyltransferase (E2) component
MADFEFTPNFFERFSKGIQIPLGGTEHDAIHSVRRQLEEMSLTPNDSAVVELVRKARSGALDSSDM